MSGEGARGVIFLFSIFYVSCNFFSRNRRTLFGPLKCRQTLFSGQILFYKFFCDSFRFTHETPIVNAFLLSFAMKLREANLRPTYLHSAFMIPHILVWDVNKGQILVPLIPLNVPGDRFLVFIFLL